MFDSDRILKSPVPSGEIVGGKYRVGKVLGGGGMGVVVAATHEELGQPVALKFIRPEALSGKGTVERFMREARAAVRLKSEHIARVFDVGRHDDQPYMVLELLEGSDLARLNKHRGPLPVADAVEYVLQACEALIEAHAAGIVHRDLKPQNLFVTRRVNGAPLVKVLDFGIAKAVGPSASELALTDSSAIIGSPLYMAPEQMRSARSADVRSDVWALGVILYEILGGQVPFDGETVTAVCIRVVNETPESLSKLRPGLEDGLVDAVMKCLEKQPHQRWQNVAQLATALEPYSRSAKQGGPVRTWRSFEDTAESQFSPPETVHPDATGPATQITLQEPKVAVMTPSSLVSTDVTWGGGPTPTGLPSRGDSMTARSRSPLRIATVGSLALIGIASTLYLGRAAPAPRSEAPPPSAELKATALSESTTVPAPSEPKPANANPDPKTANADPKTANADPKTANAESTSSKSVPKVPSGRPPPKQQAGADPIPTPPPSAVPARSSAPVNQRPEPVNGAPILH